MITQRKDEKKSGRINNQVRAYDFQKNGKNESQMRVGDFVKKYFFRSQICVYDDRFSKLYLLRCLSEIAFLIIGLSLI